MDQLYGQLQRHIHITLMQLLKVWALITQTINATEAKAKTKKNNEEKSANYMTFDIGKDNSNIWLYL